MARRACDSLGAIHRAAIGLDSATYPYLDKIDPKNLSRAVRLCIAGHAHVALILRDPDTTDAEKLGALYALMPHALEHMHRTIARRRENDPYAHQETANHGPKDT